MPRKRPAQADESSMSTVIGKQVKAFGDSVIEAHREAMEYWSVQDVALGGPVVVRLVIEIVERRRSKAGLEPGERAACAEACRNLLRALTEGRTMIQEMNNRGYDVKGAAEYPDSILAIRELLAWLLESPSAQNARPVGPTYDDLVAASKTQPPPQSWFDEDVSGLRTPAN